MNTLHHSGAAILCIDDRQTKAALDLLKRVLETAGYFVLATTTRRKLLKYFIKTKLTSSCAHQQKSWNCAPCIRAECLMMPIHGSMFQSMCRVN